VEEGTYQPIYVFSVHLENGDLVQKCIKREPPQPGGYIILIIDETYKRFDVREVSTADHDGYQHYVLQVTPYEIPVQ
jgi:hypothetical protein